MTTFKKSILREYFESIVIAVILALFIRTFVVQAFKIPTGSMEENLLIGDHLLVNKFVMGPTRTSVERTLLPVGTIKRGDVIVFKYPVEPERDFIKRVIGLPGESMDMDSLGHITINGAPIEEPYLAPQRNQAARARWNNVRNDFKYVKPHYYFVMGDNRDASNDSRSWGLVPEKYIYGKAMFRYWPLPRIGSLDSTVDVEDER